jgi:hypothetical protein
MLAAMRTLGCLACVALCACKFSAPEGNGETVDAPPNTSVDAKEFKDAPPEPNKCFGSGLGKLCLSELPTMPLMLDGTIDTDVAANCTEVITVGSTLSCVKAGTTVGLAGNKTARGVGSRPLVIVATTTMTIDGTLTVGSVRGGPSGAGASTAACTAPAPPQNDVEGSGGGAGGSFAGNGGDGGRGDLNNAPNGTADPGQHALALATITTLRAGCGGGNGGDGTTNGRGVGGAGGGAVYLIAGSEIQINGRVTAHGAGGTGGDYESGGGGGGSGGMIGLDALAVMVAGGAAVTANGGGGGEGGALLTIRCISGSDGSTSGSRAAGGFQPNNDGGNNDGGNGGPSSGNNGGGTATNGVTGTGDNGGGGGGGGGAGFIYVKGTLTNGGTISPPATPAPAAIAN